jgi:hypothetical protein
MAFRRPPADIIEPPSAYYRSTVMEPPSILLVNYFVAVFHLLKVTPTLDLQSNGSHIRLANIKFWENLELEVLVEEDECRR